MNFKKRIEVAVRRGLGLEYKTEAFQCGGNLQRKVLLIVDVDYSDGWEPGYISKNPERQQVINYIVSRLAWARSNSIPVIFVILDSALYKKHKSQLQYDGNCIGCGDGNKLAEPLSHRHGLFEPIFIKNDADAFKNPELAPYLRSIGAKELLLVGCNTFSCIQATARGAVEAGFDITLFEDATYPIFGSVSSKESWISEVRYCAQDSKINVAVTGAHG